MLPGLALCFLSVLSCDSMLGTVVILAPQRNKKDFGSDRFCLLKNAVASTAKNFIRLHCNYTIHVLVSLDHELDQFDGPYTAQDRAQIQLAAKRHGAAVVFKDINMYSREALEPNTTRAQIAKWNRPGGFEGSVIGRPLGYRSMCRLWSGRLQRMNFLKPYTYYMRIDDDSLFTAELPFDPFEEMKRQGLEYAWKRDDKDHWGIDKLWRIARPLLDSTVIKKNQLSQLWAAGGKYQGGQPYNNFHVSSLRLWQRSETKMLWRQANKQHLFFKYRVGDANYHAIVAMMTGSRFARWPNLPYIHNTNDDPDYSANAAKSRCQERRAVPRFKVNL